MSYDEIKRVFDDLLEDIKERGVWRAKWKKNKWVINAPKEGEHLIGYDEPINVGFTFTLDVQYKNEAFEP